MEVGVWDGNNLLTISLTLILVKQNLNIFSDFLLSKWYIVFLPIFEHQCFVQVPGSHFIVFPGTSEHHRSRGRSYCGGNNCNLDLQKVSIDNW